MRMIVYLTEEKPMLVRVHRRVCVERGAAAAAKWAEKKRIKRSKCKRRKKEELLAHGRGGGSQPPNKRTSLGAEHFRVRRLTCAKKYSPHPTKNDGRGAPSLILSFLAAAAMGRTTDFCFQPLRPAKAVAPSASHGAHRFHFTSAQLSSIPQSEYTAHGKSTSAIMIIHHLLLIASFVASIQGKH
jgi:hypothetical protein